MIDKLNRQTEDDASIMPQNNKLKDALEAIELIDKLIFIDTAYDWTKYRSMRHFDPVLQKLFDLGFEFSERKEEEMQVTSEELLLNSRCACDESENLNITYEVYFGKKGIILRIIDDGPGFDHRKELRERLQNNRGLTVDMALYERSCDDYPSGTGFFCLIHFAEDFYFNEKGNEITVRFKLD